MRATWVAVAGLTGCGRIGFGDLATQGDSRTIDIDASGIYLTAFAYWKLDDGAGATALDSSGHGRTLMLVNGPTWTTGMFGDGVTADGVNDFMTAQLDLSGASGATVSLWVRRTYNASSVHTLFELSPNFNGSNHSFAFFPDDITECTGGKLLLGVHGGFGYTMTCFAQPTSGQWHHLVSVYDRSTPNDDITFYLDGIQQAPVSTPSTGNNMDNFGSEPLFVFSRGGASEFDSGTVDEIAVFDRALSPAEVAMLR